MPAVESYVKDLSETLVAKTAVLPTVSANYERTLIEKLSVIVEEIDAAASSLESSLIEYKTITDVTKSAALIRDVILQKMAELRIVADEAETLTAEKYWPFPTYDKLLFGV